MGSNSPDRMHHESDSAAPLKANSEELGEGIRMRVAVNLGRTLATRLRSEAGCVSSHAAHGSLRLRVTLSIAGLSVTRFKPRRPTLKVCKLSSQEVACLQHYGDMPSCNRHHHMTPKQALEGIESDLLVPFGEEYGLVAVVEQASNNRTWRGRQSGGYQVMQLVNA